MVIFGTSSWEANVKSYVFANYGSADDISYVSLNLISEKSLMVSDTKFI